VNGDRTISVVHSGRVRKAAHLERGTPPFGRIRKRADSDGSHDNAGGEHGKRADYHHLARLEDAGKRRAQSFIERGELDGYAK
jgi:hypothetical protein